MSKSFKVKGPEYQDTGRGCHAIMRMPIKSVRSASETIRMTVKTGMFTEEGKSIRQEIEGKKEFLVKLVGKTGKAQFPDRMFGESTIILVGRFGYIDDEKIAELVPGSEAVEPLLMTIERYREELLGLFKEARARFGKKFAKSLSPSDELSETRELLMLKAERIHLIKNFLGMEKEGMQTIDLNRLTPPDFALVFPQALDTISSASGWIALFKEKRAIEISAYSFYIVSGTGRGNLRGVPFESTKREMFGAGKEALISFKGE